MLFANILPRVSSILGNCSSLELVTYVISISFTLGFSRAVYLLYFHPLASFPGPYKAALSTWWQYGLSKSGKTEEILEQLHQKYNTHALRIGPNELHITDSKLYHTIYSQRYIFPKHEFFYDAFNTPHSVFVEADKDAHRVRRKLLNNFFSKSMMRQMQLVLLSKINVLCNRISETKGDSAIYLYNAFRCLTVDFISEFAFGESFNLLTDAPKTTFSAPFVECFDLAAESLWDLLYMPIIRTIINKCPPALAAKLSEPAARFQGLIQAVANTVDGFRLKKSSGKSLDHEVIFDSMQHLDDKLMLAEATDILVAGSDTTAFTLSVAFQEIMEKPVIFEQLRKELRDAGIVTEQDFDLVKLEQLPYLTACVKEALRVAMPTPGRLPRVVPAGVEPLVVDEKVIPTGAIIGISSYTVHFDESIWGKDARSFNPARWQAGDAKELEKYLVTFSKGARQCLGINMAYAEITLTLAMLVNRFRFTVDETLTELDVNRKDYFVNAFEGTGVRAFVHEDKM